MPNLTNQIAAQASGVAGISSNPIQPLSIGTLLNNGGGISSSAWAILGAENTSPHELLKKYEVYESNESLLTLSVTAKRVLQETKVFYRMTDRDLYSKIIPEDRNLADQIQNYYSKKVMMWRLKNDRLTHFREDMNKFIHSDMKVFRENMIGVAYYLPIFYKYDVQMDNIKLNFSKDQSFKKMDSKGTPGSMTITETLTPIERIERKTKHNKKIQYWFKENEFNAGVLIELLEKNPLQNIWDKLFDKKEPMTIKGKYVRNNLDDFEYYSVTNWTLE